MTNNKEITLLDCTLRDGGYYNSWDFDHELIQEYILAMPGAGVNVVELGFRTKNRKGFKGACAYTTDSFIQSLDVPNNLTFCVMINASEIIIKDRFCEEILTKLFPLDSQSSSISLVRIACHVHEFIEALNACNYLQSKGYRVAFNVMQITECNDKKITSIAKQAANYPIDVLYFADSLGSMTPKKLSEVVGLLRRHWQGELGFHAHDNIGLGLSNSLYALDVGVSWVDSTVTGMGRGAGNVKTELLVIEIAKLRDFSCNLIPLMSVILKWFKPLQDQYNWGTNVFYYLSGKNSVHPSYVQEMMADSRYSEEDIVAVINHLGIEGGNKFSKSALSEARNYFSDEPQGNWSPVQMFKDKEVLLLGTGPGVSKYKKAIETYIKNVKPLVIALNAQSVIEESLIDVRIACHPIRLQADCDSLNSFSQPLITPASKLPKNIVDSLSSISLLDYGLGIRETEYLYKDTFCILSSPLVVSYALAVVSSGKAKRLLLAGFDGYGSDDSRRHENDLIFEKHTKVEFAVPLIAVTPTLYKIETTSIYSLEN